MTALPTLRHQWQLAEIAHKVGYLVYLERLAYHPVSGEAYVDERWLGRITDDDLKAIEDGRLDLEMPFFYENPECVRCGVQTDKKWSKRCDVCVTEARAERQKAGVA